MLPRDWHILRNIRVRSNWFNLNLYTKKSHYFHYAHGSEHIAGEELLHAS